MLTLNNIDISRGNQELIRNFSVTLLRGACLNIYGPNGCGKTSLFNTLASLSKISKNTIFYNNIDVTEAIDEYRWLTSYLGHKNGLTPEFSVNDNLRFWGAMNNREESVDAALTSLELFEYADKKISDLSVGLARRVGLSKLLLSNSTIWFLDEPFANLDHNSRELACNMIKAKLNQGGIVLLSSHAPLNDFKMLHINLEDCRDE